MKIRIHNDDNTDYIDLEWTLEEIKLQAKDRIILPWWKNWWSEEI